MARPTTTRDDVTSKYNMDDDGEVGSDGIEIDQGVDESDKLTKKLCGALCLEHWARSYRTSRTVTLLPLWVLLRRRER